MPFVEDVAVKPPDPNAWIGSNVLIVTPGLFCALGLAEVAGLWQPIRPVVQPWRTRRPPVARGWKSLPPGRGGF
jgi:hypothetical protein